MTPAETLASIPSHLVDASLGRELEAARAFLRAGGSPADRNRTRARVEPLPPGAVETLPPEGSDDRRELDELGRARIARGEVAVLVLGGGMATRFGSVVKALVPVIDDASFLELKLRDVAARRTELGVAIPFLCLTSFATHGALLGALRAFDDATAVEQFAAPRLTPEGDTFIEGGKPSLAAMGHGDVLPALAVRGALAGLEARGVRTLVVSNVDNLAATLDPALVALHARGGARVTIECAPKRPGDKGGAPATLDGVPAIVEGFRFPAEFDQDAIPVFNTNTLLIDLAVAHEHPSLDAFLVEKRVDGRPCVQLERLVGQLAERTTSHFVEVERAGRASRFLPVKEVEDLERVRPALREVLAARGLLEG